MTLRIGLDVGGTTVHGVALDDDGTVVAQHTHPSQQGATGVVDAITEMVRELRASTGSDTGDESIGVGLPGIVASGGVRHAVNLGIDGEPVDIGAALLALTRGPVAVENDVKAAALGAHRWLAEHEPGVDDVALLNVGTGLAAGLVLGGRLRHGANGMAGEIGHLVYDPAGPPCPCGKRGCLELYASGSGLRRSWSGTAAELFEAAAGGDDLASALATQLVNGLAHAISLLAYGPDVERILVTGGVVSATPALREAIIERLQLDGRTPLGRAAAVAERIGWLPADHPAGALGAALLVGQEVPWRS